VGNRSQVVDTTGTTGYAYDGLYRLTGVTYPNLDVQSYTYDQMGNRLTKVQNSVPTTYTGDDAGQMTAAGATAYTYDNNGNTSAAGADSYTWDTENRLTGTQHHVSSTASTQRPLAQQAWRHKACERWL